MTPTSKQLRLKEVRKSRGLTQAELARRIGTTAQNVQRIERGERNPTVTTLIRIADALDLELVVELRDTHGKVP